MKKYKTDFSREELHAALHANDNEAVSIIEDADKWSKFEEQFEAFAKKAEKIPILGGVIDDIICMVELVDSYVKREYRDIPVGTIVSIVSALIYLLSPIDIIPDMIPVIGYVDDVAVVHFILKFGVGRDLDKYRMWKEESRRSALDFFEQVFAEELAQVIGDGYLAAIIVSENNTIKMLVAMEQDSELPADCIVKEVKVPVKALAEIDVEETEDVIGILDDTIVRENIRWMNGTRKRTYLEPDFDEKWDDFIIHEGC
ncbi:MAG: DUF1232 domain-containing protein [Lachnospiraceae bacterium]|nr:DUF1232 domain-containing protein [Lachnospiraceae bacterium]MDE7332585.1 DUF1232 domain-containing protein [Lachnospiraceae bacterium]